MSRHTAFATPRARRLVALAAAALALSALLGVWLWQQRSSGSPPERELAQKAATADPTEHKYTNHLIHETSPYLLQHAHNPVDWYPWGNEAFEKARREGKPIFLSVGYSTCYWCHVMEKESFEDPEVAEILNKHFIAIKVDREERPDIDEQYMLATQLVTRRGGWPNSVWLTPDGKPWMAGTYFPKPRFMAALRQLADLWENRRDEVNQQADALARGIAQIAGGGMETGGGVEAGGELQESLLERAVTALTRSFDPQRGGFGSAPKFPPHGTLRLLIRQYRDTRNQALVEPITKTLDAIWLGGMHDHIGGGFHRYSTDAQWLVPHFEKMLYDNAQLLRVYTDGYLLTNKQRYRQAVDDIFRWVQQEMTSPEGAFYSAIDSGEVGKEGETYVWHVDEVREVLGAEDSELLIEVYNLKPHGNFTDETTGERPGTNIPHLDRPIEAIARGRGVEPAAFHNQLAAMRKKLLARRQTWTQPHKDDKILTSWNGLMIASLAYAGRQLDDPRYTAAAARAADFILDSMRRDGALLRTYRDGQAKQPAYLDDYAYLAEGLIELYLATDDSRWLEHAQQLAQTLLDDFQDERGGGFFFTTAGHEDLLVRSKSLTGGGNMPNANGVAAGVLLRVTRLANDAKYAAAATRTLQALVGLVEQNPHGNEDLLLAVATRLRQPPTARPAAEKAAAASPEKPEPHGNADVRRRVEPVTIHAYLSRSSARPGQTIDVAVAIDIDDGWHLYGENPAANFLIPSSVKVKDTPGLTASDVVPPKPHRMVDPILKQPLNIYSDRIWFRFSVHVADDAERGPTSLELVVKTQACDDSRCLPPATTTLRLPFQIDPDAAADETRHPAVFSQ